jgi:hypothetical protein
MCTVAVTLVYRKYGKQETFMYKRVEGIYIHIIIIIIIIRLRLRIINLTANGLSPGGRGFYACT